jgi:hypothetical protein
MSSGAPSSGPDHSVGPAGGKADEGRRYWKAAITHLAPEKREAAWEFYLDRLESSAAADTLGGVMLLLEAHLAFFDDLPARLSRTAREIEAAAQSSGQPNSGATSPSAPVCSASAASSPRRWPSSSIAGVSAAAGGLAACAIFLAVSHHGTLAPAETPAPAGHAWLPRASSVRVEPWNDAATHRQRGAVISLGSVAWTERTASGGAIIYVLSPAEEVRRDLEGLRKVAE